MRSVQRNDRGFSLIELIIVLVLMALIASMAALSLRGVVARQRLARGVQVIQQFDVELRRSARVGRSGDSGVVDPSQGRLQISSSKRYFQLPSQVRIESLRINGGGREITAQSDGSTETYAMKLTSDGASRWLLLVGGSGQFIAEADGRLVNAMVSTR